jgi:hypothetical protein
MRDATTSPNASGMPSGSLTPKSRERISCEVQREPTFDANVRREAPA